MLLKINNRIINSAKITVATLDKNGTVTVGFQTAGPTLVNELFTGDEGAKLWRYLQTEANDVLTLQKES